jgi:vitamin B12 transporter
MEKPMHLRTMSLAVTAILAASPALPLHAQTGERATELDEILVTANRTAVSVNDALVPVEVIDRETIERSQAHDLPDLLRGRAGISISNQGGAGKLSTMFMRGSESDHVLVLVDGVRIGSPTSGLAALQDLPLALVDRVEIVRGPRSSLYGADAIGGVIQIFTRRDREGLHPRASATVGSNGYAEGSAGIGGRHGRGWFGIDTSYTNTDGFNACRGRGPDPSVPFDFGAGCFTDEPDDDGYRNRSLSARGGFDASDSLSFNVHALRAEGRNEYDGTFQNLSKVTQQVVGGQAQWRPSDTVQLKLTVGRNTDASDNYVDGTDAGRFDTDRDSATLQGDFGVGEAQLISVGLDWLRDRVDGSTSYSDIITGRRVDERGNRAAFVQYQGVFGAQSFEASVRRDDNEQFDGHTTGSAAWGIAFADAWRVTAGYGTAFKAPTFNELYFPLFGNSELRPEESKTWELGLAYRGDHFNWRIDGFSTRVDDLIAFDAAISLPNNIDRARMQGAEIGLDTTLLGWDLDASASFVDTENRSGFNAGNDLPRRAERSARIDLDRAFGAFRLGFTGVAAGPRYDDVANTRRLGGYATFDIRAEYAIAPAWTVQARLANLFDRDYETAEFYNQSGREWFVTVRYAPAN